MNQIHAVCVNKCLFQEGIFRSTFYLVSGQDAQHSCRRLSVKLPYTSTNRAIASRSTAEQRHCGRCNKRQEVLLRRTYSDEQIQNQSTYFFYLALFAAWQHKPIGQKFCVVGDVSTGQTSRPNPPSRSGQPQPNRHRH